MFSDDVPFPTDMPDFPPATRKQLLIPLSFMPVSEEEQVGNHFSLVEILLLAPMAITKLSLADGLLKFEHCIS